jgi:zinc transport system substrate-binding protein
MRKVLFFLSVFAIAACGTMQLSETDIISVSILPQKYFVERIAGDDFQINVITPPGASPETYEPTPRQVAMLMESALYFTNGFLMFEDNLIRNSGAQLSAKTIDLSEGLDLIAGDIVDHGDHVHLYGVDPHYWLGPEEVKLQLQHILDALVALKPDRREVYTQNFNEFIADIDKLDAHIRQITENRNTDIFLIYHPAFEYFARTYGLQQVSLEQDGKEPTAAHIRYIADLAKSEGINTILVQSQFNMASAEVVAKEIGGSVEFLDPLPENWLENMYSIAHTFQRALNP